MVLKKKVIETNVLDAARERFDLLYQRFDKVVISFSGGKDSTVCLHLALEAAVRNKRTPLEVMFWDEEAIHPPTIEYVERVRENPAIKLDWYCLEIEHRNACSRSQPYWRCWDRSKRDLWVRPMPRNVITQLDGFEPGMSMPNAVPLVYAGYKGTVAHVRGIRADESLRRYRSVALKKHDNWINGPVRTYWSMKNQEYEWGSGGNSFMTSPIYDWTTLDVWTAPRFFGWDYNRTYDYFDMAGQSPHDQRVCPPYGEEPLRGLYVYQICWPEMWSRMVNRVHGAATANRYSRTELYGFGDLTLPPGHTWKSWAFAQLKLYPPELRSQIGASIKRIIGDHGTKTSRPIPDVTADPLTGLSWKYIAMIVNRGDLKARRAGNVSSQATQARNKAGMTLEQVMAEDADIGTRY